MGNGGYFPTIELTTGDDWRFLVDDSRDMFSSEGKHVIKPPDQQDTKAVVYPCSLRVKALSFYPNEIY